MIGKLRARFITLSMAALFVLLSGIVTGMNVLNYNTIIGKTDVTLSLLAKNNGAFPEPDGKNKNDFPHNMSPEAPYETRYFSVLLGTDGSVLQADTGKIKAVDTRQAIELAIRIANGSRDRGFVENYRFIRCSEANTLRIIFLDCRQEISSFRIFLFISLGMALMGFLIFFFVILFFSGRIIRPVAESYEKQKRFITDAGHELKTPLTIIQADVDVLEMETGENEWLVDIRKQTQRLSGLTRDLVYLSRMEEAENALPMIEFPFSDVVAETAASFQALAKTQGKPFLCDIQPMLSLKGNEKAIQQLVNILLDNALKYSPAGGTVSLTVKKQGKTLLLTVCNTTAAPVPAGELPRLFERFYRPDTSRNSRTGGYGIGLSVAKAITTAHNGKIHAGSNGDTLQITVILPLQA